ncbi:MAG: hypothetical protein CMM33_08515 [Rhodospirillaceae bacterium]|nr:hypothetical protein [Rhodospirillaceae bacterium]|tara:strand:+ start:418 stop:636 length:219 start_codon:yes stop_codon:yes gene_type:complete
MITTLILISILGAGAAWMYYQGKTSAQAEGLESDLKKTQKVSAMDKDHDENTADILSKLSAPSLLNKPPRDR